MQRDDIMQEPSSGGEKKKKNYSKRTGKDGHREPGPQITKYKSYLHLPTEGGQLIETVLLMNARP